MLQQFVVGRDYNYLVSQRGSLGCLVHTVPHEITHIGSNTIETLRFISVIITVISELKFGVFDMLYI